jgi:hypothetical protein
MKAKFLIYEDDGGIGKSDESVKATLKMYQFEPIAA